jgi:hypothetical protein
MLLALRAGKIVRVKVFPQTKAEALKAAGVTG